MEKKQKNNKGRQSLLLVIAVCSFFISCENPWVKEITDTMAEFKPESELEIEYALGDTGPGGGKIFYVNKAGFTVQMVNPSQNYTARYLEAAPDNMDLPLAWQLNGSIAGTEAGIGTGRRNTALILATDASAPAAKACKDLTAGGKNDWFLPSKDELNQLIINRAYVGNLSYEGYWSSTELNAAAAWYQGDYQATTGKTWEAYIRAIRAF